MTAPHDEQTDPRYLPGHHECRCHNPAVKTLAPCYLCREQVSDEQCSLCAKVDEQTETEGLHGKLPDVPQELITLLRPFLNQACYFWEPKTGDLGGHVDFEDMLHQAAVIMDSYSRQQTAQVLDSDAFFKVLTAVYRHECSPSEAIEALRVGLEKNNA